MTSIEFVKIITEAGATGVSIFLIIYLIKRLTSDRMREKEWTDLMRDFNKSINNHFEHTERSYHELSGALRDLSKIQYESSLIIKGCKRNKYYDKNSNNTSQGS